MNSRNRHLARQLRAALRASRWNAGTIALRLHLSRETMVRVLVGDEEVSLGLYRMVADALELNIEFVPCPPPAEPPPPAVETVVDFVEKQLRAGTQRQPWGSFFKSGQRVSDDFLPGRTSLDS